MYGVSTGISTPTRTPSRTGGRTKNSATLTKTRTRISGRPSSPRDSTRCDTARRPAWACHPHLRLRTTFSMPVAARTDTGTLQRSGFPFTRARCPGPPQALFEEEILRILTRDGLLAIIPFFLVFFICWLQLGSWMLAAATMVEIALSWPASIFFYRVLFQIKWIPFQNFLCVYIVLAIGADDVFVFMDAWKQSFHQGAEVNKDLVTRLSWVYRRAGMAMLITSLTTALAFITSAAMTANMASFLAFGIFAGIMIFVDYTLVMTWFCSLVVVYHNNFEMKPGLCCACCP
eukprot:864699-Prymnesium_polylepis.2